MKKELPNISENELLKIKVKALLEALDKSIVDLWLPDLSDTASCCLMQDTTIKYEDNKIEETIIGFEQALNEVKELVNYK